MQRVDAEGTCSDLAVRYLALSAHFPSNFTPGAMAGHVEFQQPYSASHHRHHENGTKMGCWTLTTASMFRLCLVVLLPPAVLVQCFYTSMQGASRSPANCAPGNRG